MVERSDTTGIIDANNPHPGGVAAMASTYLNLHYHLVFSTKHQEPSVQAEWRSRLHEYLGGTVIGLGAQCRAVGGTSDHVHLLAELRATHTLADFMRELKKASSAWVHDELHIHAFAWQEGYAAFTVSASAMAEVQHYIQNQEEHHRQRSSREELELLLKRSGVEYDPKYLD